MSIDASRDQRPQMSPGTGILVVVICPVRVLETELRFFVVAVLALKLSYLSILWNPKVYPYLHLT